MEWRPDLLFAHIIFSVILIDGAVAYYYYQQQRTSCEKRCNTHRAYETYEACLRQCTNQFEYGPEETNRVAPAGRNYPLPPFNASVKFKIHVERNEKYIKATVDWKSHKDSKRVGFWLSFTAKQLNCEKKFPGYYTQDILPSANEHEIPLRTPEHRLQRIAFGCTYRVEVRSKPYIYGDPAYTNLFYVTVPNCIEGYCSCRKQARVPEPKDVQAAPFVDQSAGNRTKTLLTWQYKGRPSHQIVFHMKLAYLHRSEHKFASHISLFKFLPVEYTVDADVNKERYKYVLEDRFMPNLTYRVQLFALNRHLCSSEKIETVFYIPPNDGSVATTTAPKVTNSPTQVTIEGVWDGDKIDRRYNGKTTTTTVSYTEFEEDTVATTSSEVTVNYWLFVVAVLMLTLMAIVLFCLVRMQQTRRKKKLVKQKYLDRFRMAPWSLERGRSAPEPPMESNIIYTEQEIAEGRALGYLDEYEVPYERLQFGRVIGQGAFGMVYLGTAQSINGIIGATTVAIKQLKANADEAEREEFLAEIDIMKEVGHHPNIVSMYACCTMQFPQCMVMEYVPYGDLKRYLQNLRKQYEKAVEECRNSLNHDYVLNLRRSPDYDSAKLYNTALSARRKQQQRRKKLESSASFAEDRSAQAMTSSIISSASFTEGEIPFADDEQELTYSLDAIELQSFAQQVACGMAHVEMLGITHRDLAARNILVGHGKVLKISDFGMSRIGTYVKHTRGVIPLRWLSIEAIRDNLYTTKSDVWAYAVLLWEISTLGGFPYPTVQDKDLLRYMESGGRLEKPTSCSDEFYDVMLECWSYTASKRPSFSRLVDRLAEMERADSPYVEFAAPPSLADDQQPLPPPDAARPSMTTSVHSGIVPSEII